MKFLQGWGKLCSQGVCYLHINEGRISLSSVSEKVYDSSLGSESNDKDPRLYLHPEISGQWR